MPILHFHLAEGQHSAAQHAELLQRASRFFAEVLQAPVDRVRVFIHLYRPDLVAIGGRLVSESGARAPYFHFVLLAGRTASDRERLLKGFTDLVVEILDVPRDAVRGGIVPVAPEDWAIGGVLASEKRAVEIQARKEAAG